jgi:hypothetical protein
MSREMKKVISISEVIELIPWESKTAELCATAEAVYDKEHGKVVVELDAYVAPVDIVKDEERIRPPWLLPKETFATGVDLEEAAEVARDVFQNWVKRLRHASPDPVRA